MRGKTGQQVSPSGDEVGFLAPDLAARRSRARLDPESVVGLYRNEHRVRAGDHWRPVVSQKSDTGQLRILIDRSRPKNPCELRRLPGRGRGVLCITSMAAPRGLRLRMGGGGDAETGDDCGYDRFHGMLRIRVLSREA